MEEIDIELITKRSIRGVFALVSRTFLLQIIGFVANFSLTIFLTPSAFGIYFVVTAAITFLTYFSDIGLAGALIQQKEDITREELKTTFTIQQILVVSVSIIAIFLSGKVGEFYHFQGNGIMLFDALVISFFFSSLKTIPSIILERNLRFEKLVIPQIVETLLFNIVAVVLAIKGFGVTSFTYAVLARGIGGVIVMYAIAPWKIGIGFNKTIAKNLLSFGVPFQANSFIALLKDDLLIAYLGKILPIAQVGYIGFAQKWAYTPLRLIMDNVIRITFPAFSRLQHDKNILSQAVEKSLFTATFFIFPGIVGLLIVFPILFTVIPKYSKWEPALFSLTFFAINAACSSLSTPLTNALNSIGKIKISLYLMIFWTIATWVITPIFIKFYGFNGVAIASALISLSFVYVVHLVKKHISISVYKTIFSPLLATCIMGVILYGTSLVMPKNYFSVIVIIILGIIVYFATMFLIAKKQMVGDIATIKENLRK